MDGQVEPQARILILASEWDDLKAAVQEGRQFAMEARDSSRSNAQTIVQVLLPKITLVEQHETSIQQGRGALWAFGVLGGILTLAATVMSAVALFHG